MVALRVLVAFSAVWFQASNAMTMDDAKWKDAWETLDTCLLSMAICKDFGTGRLQPILNNQFVCEQKGHLWSRTFQSVSEFKAASESKHLSLLQSGQFGVVLAKIHPNTRVDHVEHAIERSFSAIAHGDAIHCAQSGSFVYLDGQLEDLKAFLASPIGLANIAYAFIVPDELKTSPFLAEYEQDMERVAKRKGLDKHNAGKVMRRFRLSPGSQVRAKAILENLRNKHDSRRRLLAYESDLQLHLEYPFHAEHAHARKLESEEVIASSSFGETDMFWLLAEPEILWVEPVVTFHHANMDALHVTHTATNIAGSDYSGKDDLSPLWEAGVHGEGQIVGVGDTGLDTDHCFFRDEGFDMNRETGTITNYPEHRKLAQYFAYVDGIDGELQGHGTHVSGSIAGLADSDEPSNVGDPNNMKGMAYNARIAFADIGRAGSAAVFPPSDLNGIFFPPAYQVGARIHSNSWTSTLNTYSADCQGIDRFSYRNQDVLILFATGNEGPKRGGTGGSVGSPATAKNCLSVGASLNSERTFNLVNQPIPSAGGQCINSLAEFSSNGPTTDGRIKPDVVAPGKYIGSSSGSTKCQMTFFQGTSMATPVVAGNAALVRQFLVEGRYPTGRKNTVSAFKPMGALIKAILVNGADLLSGTYDNPAAATLDGTKPDVDQGFGRIHLTNNILVNGNTEEKAVYLDGDFEDMPTISTTGSKATYIFIIKRQPKEAFKATLVWHDPEASLQSTKTLVNDLDLQIEAPDGEIFYPNGLSEPDRVNNVEHIVIPASRLAQGGNWTVTVTGAEINRDSQVFAFAATLPLDFSIAVPGAVMREDGSTRILYKPVPPEEFPLLPIVGAGAAVIIIGAALYVWRGNGTLQPSLPRQLKPAAFADALSMPAARFPSMQRIYPGNQRQQPPPPPPQVNMVHAQPMMYQQHQKPIANLNQMQATPPPFDRRQSPPLQAMPPPALAQANNSQALPMAPRRGTFPQTQSNLDASGFESQQQGRPKTKKKSSKKDRARSERSGDSKRSGGSGKGIDLDTFRKKSTTTSVDEML